jgi:hypothetical protein
VPRAKRLDGRDMVIIETVTKPEDGRREQGELNAGWKHSCNSFNAMPTRRWQGARSESDGQLTLESGAGRAYSAVIPPEYVVCGTLLRRQHLRAQAGQPRPLATTPCPTPC